MGRMATLRVTLDTNQLDDEQIERVRARLPADHELAIVTVSNRERGVEVELRTVTETGVWGESVWGGALWGAQRVAEPFVLGESPLGVGALVDGAGADLFEGILAVISNGSFPAPGHRDSLTDGQRRQLRDAMIFLAHVRDGRDLFVTDDRRGFVKNGRREALERLGATKIVTSDEVGS